MARIPARLKTFMIVPVRLSSRKESGLSPNDSSGIQSGEPDSRVSPPEQHNECRTQAARSPRGSWRETREMQPRRCRTQAWQTSSPTAAETRNRRPSETRIRIDRKGAAHAFVGNLSDGITPTFIIPTNRVKKNADKRDGRVTPAGLLVRDLLEVHLDKISPAQNEGEWRQEY